jgi:sialidase-1
VDGSNEATATALSNSRLMMNMRNQKGDIKSRIVAISNNGGVQWDTIYFDKQLPDPVCEGSILTIGRRSQKNILAFCNNADSSIRDNLTLRISFDDGKTWQKNITIDKTGKADNSAYSDIVQLDKKKIGILYEKNNYSSIVFTAVKW